MSPYAGNDIFITEFIGYVFDIKLLCTGEFCSFFKSVKFAALTTVDTAANNFVIEVFFQPGDNRGGIKSAGICQYNFFFHS